MKKVIFGGIIIFLVIFLVLFGGIMAFRYFTAEIRGIVPAEERIQSADFRIYSYEYFYNQLATINAEEANYDAQYERLQTLTTESDEYNRVQRNLAAIKAHIERLKRQYNADSKKEGTRGQFRATDLPYQLDIQPHEYGRRTQ